MFIGSQKSARWLHMGIGFEPQTSLLLGPRLDPVLGRFSAPKKIKKIFKIVLKIEFRVAVFEKIRHPPIVGPERTHLKCC